MIRFDELIVDPASSDCTFEALINLASSGVLLATISAYVREFQRGYFFTDRTFETLVLFLRYVLHWGQPR